MILMEESVLSLKENTVGLPTFKLSASTKHVLRITVKYYF